MMPEWCVAWSHLSVCAWDIAGGRPVMLRKGYLCVRMRSVTVPRALVGGALGVSGAERTWVWPRPVCTLGACAPVPSSDSSACALGEQDAGGQGARWPHGTSALLERDGRPQPPQSLVSGDVGPCCRSGCPTVPLAHQPPDPPSSVRTAPPSWPDAPATGAALAWGPLRDGHRRPRRGPRSPLGGRSTDGSGPCLPLAPVATAAPERPAEGSRASGSESVSWDESGAMDLALGGP